MYAGAPDGTFHAHGIHLIEQRDGAIVRLVVFLNPELFPAFGLPNSSSAEQLGRAAARPGGHLAGAEQVRVHRPSDRVLLPDVAGAGRVAGIAVPPAELAAAIVLQR